MKKWGFCSILVPWCIVLSISATHSAVYVVDATLDSADPVYQACTVAANDCSLRGAIIAGNNNPGRDTVRVPAGVYVLTLVGEDAIGLVGDLDITDTLVLRGMGGGATIDGTIPVTRVLDVINSSDGLVEISNLILTGGTSADGAGLRVTTGEVTLTQVTIQGNSAMSNNGGGISNSGILRIRNSTIQGNTAQTDGAGIYNGPDATLEVIQSVVQTNISDRHGGGLYNDGTATFAGSTISGNISVSTGGGIDNRGTLMLLQTTVDQNSATGNLASGGGILNASRMSIRGGTISNNSAPAGFGGGIMNSYLTTMDIRNHTQITGNTATYGGGIDTRSDTLLRQVDITSNSAFDGGGIYGGGNGAPITLRQTTVSNNSADADGGGIHLSSADVLIQGCVVSDNSAGTFGGGIYVLDNGPHSFVVMNSEITGNSVINAGSEGGGFFAYTTDTRLYQVTVSANSAEGNGGGIKNTDGSMLMYGSTISQNTAQLDGGGIHNDFDGSTATISITNSTLSGNVAVGNGGAVYNLSDGGTAEIYLFNVTVSSNDAMASVSDGIFLSGGLMRSRHSIIGQQITPGADCLAALGAIIQAPGANLEEGTSCGFALNSQIPNLDPLADNGGPTQTHALQTGSPAVDAGNPGGCPADQNGDGIPDYILTTDQRNLLRDPLCDLGAYELQ